MVSAAAADDDDVRKCDRRSLRGREAKMRAD